MRKKIYKYSLVFACLALIMAITKFNLHEPNSKVTISLSEPELSIQNLEELSDIIIIAEVKSVKERTIKTIDTSAADPESLTSKDNKTVKLKAPVVIYNLKIETLISGNYKFKNVDLVIPDLTMENLTGLEEGKTYKFYLEKNDFYGENSYNLVSFSQGFEEAN